MDVFRLIYLIVTAFFLSGCVAVRDDIWVKRNAGDNVEELIMVLQHYREGRDAEKYQAARFLIRNMYYHHSLGGDYESYYKEADRVLDSGLNESELFDSLEHLSESFSRSVLQQRDIDAITYDFLVSNIDEAFDQWRNGKYLKHLTFKEFCEIVLPYTCSEQQPLVDWRTDFRDFASGTIEHMDECYDFEYDAREPLSSVNSTLKRMVPGQEWIKQLHGIPVYDPEVFVKFPGASCDEYCEMGTMIFRSKGFPVSIDFSPQWADRQQGHSWCVLHTIKGKTVMFNSFGSNPFYPNLPFLKFPKIFRRTYSVNTEYLKLVNSGKLYPVLGNPCFIDVTDEYYRTSDIEIRLLPEFRHSKRVYLGLFNCYEWRPVFWGTISAGKAHFKNVGNNFTGIALVYDGKSFVPASLPFVIGVDGKIRYIEGDSSDVISFRIYRKNPMYQHVYRRESTLHGGYVEASDGPEFDSAEVVCRFPEWELTSGKVPVVQTKPFRYWRFCAENGSVSDMAELFFYSDDSVQVSPSVYNPSMGFKLLLDRNPLTFFSASGAEYHGCLDFGEPIKLSSVSYVRRGDGNAIFPGDEYEVSYWDGTGMTTIGHYQAKDIFLDIENAPKDCLYYIQGISRGVQNRIFEYDVLTEKVVWH